MTDSVSRAEPTARTDVPVGESQAIPDRGPWLVNVWPGEKVVLQSDDFTHDVALEISGDFASHDEKRAYAKALADWMNLNLPATARRRPPAPN
jgi:hypothetical protein